jgi:hypothetical protein
MEADIDQDTNKDDEGNRDPEFGIEHGPFLSV